MQELQSKSIQHNQNVFETLYKEYFNTVLRFITKNQGTFEDAQDIFQDTMLVLTEKLRKDDFVLTATLKTYIMAIAKNLWFKKLRNFNKKVSFEEDIHQKFLGEVSIFIEKEKTYWDKLYYYLDKITHHCSKLLHDLYFHNKTLEQIKEEYGYSTLHNAQNQKYKCMEQIKKMKDLETLSKN
jgi:RNA polymerase sigma factor (sigma-70 family)